MDSIPTSQAHIPVLCEKMVELLQPVGGTWIDCTAGAGGFTVALLAAGAEKVVAIDCDPDACRLVGDRIAMRGGKVTVVNAHFADFDDLPEVSDCGEVSGVVFDLGVSSMQLDQPRRGFSFSDDGPLDMRMSGQGPDATDLVNSASEKRLADILYQLGEEPGARRIARAIVRSRRKGPIDTTRRLARIIVNCTSPRRSNTHRHPATRSFQALRIAVNDELEQLAAGLRASERVLGQGGKLAVVTFHSLEDRLVKRFLHGESIVTNRHLPPRKCYRRSFVPLIRRPVVPDKQEIAANRRSRSARLRIGIRTGSPPGKLPPGYLPAIATAGTN